MEAARALKSVSADRRSALLSIWKSVTKYPVGRMVLHLICIVKHPSNFKWHLRGIGREICFVNHG